jgi:hypothetical protein
MLAGALCVAMLSPWLIRNTVYTGNPVFPLATNIFGRGYWSQESQERFQAGHGRADLPPVPPPAGAALPTPRQPDRLKAMFTNFLGDSEFALPLVVLTLVAACLVLAGAKGGGAWERALLAVLVMQVALWAAVTHDMPPRFLAIAIVPMTLLSGGLLARLSRVAKNPLRKNAPTGGRWGLSAASVILVVAALVNLATAFNMLDEASGNPVAQTDRYRPGPDFAKDLSIVEMLDMPKTSKILLVGQATAFYMPADTIYATVFDSDGARPIPLGKTPSETLSNLRALGVTHILVDWQEMDRLAKSYGYPAAYVGDMFERESVQGQKKVVNEVGDAIVEGGRIGLNWLDPLGLILVKHIQSPDFGQKPSSQPASSPATAPAAEARAPLDLSAFHSDYFHTLVNERNPRRMLLTRFSVYQLPPK